MTATIRRIADLHVPIMVIGPDGSVGYANPAAHRMFAYPAGGLLGLPLHQLTPPESLDQLSQETQVGSGDRIRRVQSQVVRADGTLVDVNVTIEPAAQERSEGTPFVLSYEPLPPWKVRRAV